MANFNIDYLVVAGGGGAGASGTNGSGSGGGGAGGLLTSTGATSLTLDSNVTYSVTVGDGGSGAVGVVTPRYTTGNNGDNSEFSGIGITTITAIGGGGGSSGSDAQTTANSGGSGGGSGYNGIGAAGTAGQGNAGGSSSSGAPYAASGGGGAGSAGAGAPNNSTGGNGGDGLLNSITGSNTFYAGGGGGSPSYNGSGLGGSGGSNVGGDGTNGLTGNNGTINTGSGGGAASPTTGSNSTGGDGGSGVVIIRYTTADVASYAVTGAAPTEDTTTVAGQTILSFTTVGTGSITFTASIPTFSGTKISNELLDLNQQNNEIGLRVPVGNDANQPTSNVSNTGSIRYNTDAQGLSISDGTEFQTVDSSQSTLPTVTLTNSWRAWDTASFTNGGTTCTDVTGGLVLGPYSSGSPGAFFYGSFNNVAGNKYWVLNGGGSHARRAGFTRPTEFTISYWGNKPNNPGYNSERAIWTFNAFGSENIRLARRNNAGTSSLRIYSGNSSIATFADGITTNTWYNITLTFSLNTVKTYLGVQGSTNTTLINTTTLSSGNFPTGILNANGTGFWIGTNSGYVDWLTDSWSGLNIYDGVARQSEIDTIVSNGYQQ